MNNHEIASKTRQLIVNYLAKWEQKYPQTPIPMPPIQWKIGGSHLGTCYTDKISFNLVAAQEMPDNFFNDTVPHELAHWIQFRHFKKRTKPHGEEWQWVCVQLTGRRLTTTAKWVDADLKAKLKTRKTKRLELLDEQTGEVFWITQTLHTKRTRKGSWSINPKTRNRLVLTGRYKVS